MNPAMNPTEPVKANTIGMLRLLVYGTLKRGFWNHDRFCRGVLAVEDAVIRGRLFETPSGIPVLQVPEGDILAVGTTHSCADVATQAQVTARIHDPDSLPPAGSRRTPQARLGDYVRGATDLRTTRRTRLPAINRLEGFHPGGFCLYCRVWSRSRSTGTCFRHGSMGKNPLSSRFTPLVGILAGPGILSSVKSGKTRKTG